MNPHSVIQTRCPSSSLDTKQVLSSDCTGRGARAPWPLNLSQGWFCVWRLGCVARWILLLGGHWGLLVLLFPPAGHLDDWTTEQKSSTSQGWAPKLLIPFSGSHEAVEFLGVLLASCSDT